MLSSVFSWAILLGAVVIFWSLYTGTKSTLVPEAVKLATCERRVIEVSETFDAFVSADEKVFIAPIQGHLEKIVPEGTAVRVGTPVAQIVNDPAQSRVEGEYIEAKRTLDDFTLVSTINIERIKDQILALQMEKKDLERKLRQRRAERNIWGARSFEKSLRRIEEGIDELTQRLAVEEAKARKIARGLEKEKDSKEKMLGLVSSVIMSDSPGIVSFTFDGMEGMTGKILAGGKTQEIESWLRSGSKTMRVIDGQAVDAGQEIFKIIQTVGMTAIPLADLSIDRGENGKVWVRFPEFGQSRWPARIIRNPSGQVAAALRIDAFLPEVHNKRVVRLELVKGIFQGVAVPVEAVFQKGLDHYVYLIRGERAVERKVSPGASDGEYVILNGVPEGSRVICNPWMLNGMGK
ncbi:MAG: hypothetical protein HPY52_06095 [Firmicutes bacterium]|nr:hypothetical protein [Bacillota bacterium]